MRSLLNRVIWVPLLGIAVGGALAHGMLAVDSSVALTRVPEAVQFEADNARRALSAVAGSLVTVSAVIFWLWMVTVQLASKNASTRIIHQHLSSRFQEFVLTFLAANFTYNVTVLRAVPPADDPAALATTPHLATSLGMALTAATVMVILNAVNQAAGRSQVDALARSIRDATIRAAQRLDADGDTVHDPEEPAGRGTTAVAATEGWVVGVDARRLAEAVPAGGTVRVEAPTNEFVLAGAPLATGWPELDGDAAAAAFTLGPGASVDADPGHGIRRLVEVAEQSLPPGSGNTLAIHDVLAHLTSALAAVDAHLPPSPHHRLAGRTVLRPCAHDWEGYVHLAVDRIRELAGRDAEVAEALVATMSMLAGRLDDPQRRTIVEAQVREVVDRYLDGEPSEWNRRRVEAAARS